MARLRTSALIAAWYAFVAPVPTLAQAADNQPPADLPTVYVIGTMPQPDSSSVSPENHLRP